MKNISFFAVYFFLTGCFSPEGTIATTTTNTTMISISGVTDRFVSTTSGTTEIIPHTTSDTFGSTFDQITLTTTATPDTTSTSSTSSSTSINPTSGPPPSICGDGILQPDEECDDSLLPDPIYQVECHNCFYDRKIFVSLLTFSGNIIYEDKNILQEDLYNICKQSAIDGNINTFGSIPILNWYLHHWTENFEKTEGRYILVDGQVFANNFEEILNLQNLVSPSLDAMGIPMNFAVWTGNTMSDINFHCNNWTTNIGDIDGMYGDPTSINNWIATSIQPCYSAVRIYCIQDLKWNNEVFPP